MRQQMVRGDFGRTGGKPAGGSARRPALWLREILLLALIAIYGAVSIIAYTDFPRQDARPRLTDLEWRGLELWREHNCQACHQIYGFGGFLGPDLTNMVGEDTPDEAYRSVLTSGLNRMPAFHLDQNDQTALLAYLRAMNRTGKSQPERLGARRAVDSWKHYGLILEQWKRDGGAPIPGSVRRGYGVWARNRCGVCHVPFTAGRHRAPDLSQRAVDRSIPTLTALLRDGKNNMPAYTLDDARIADLGSFLEWVALHRSDLVALNDQMLEREPFSWTAVPWFEYAP
ncbi:MAG: c-type cytochrome [Acidobacteriota bacterium]